MFLHLKITFLGSNNVVFLQKVKKNVHSALLQLMFIGFDALIRKNRPIDPPNTQHMHNNSGVLRSKTRFLWVLEGSRDVLA